MADRRRTLKTISLHLLLLPVLLYGFHAFTSGPRQYAGVDEAVVEKIAREHGREASRPLIDPGEGDLLLFLFLSAGAIGGFAAGYYWRELVRKPGA